MLARSIDDFIMHDSNQTIPVIPAKAGIQRLYWLRHWIPAFAGMTNCCNVLWKGGFKSEVQQVRDDA